MRVRGTFQNIETFIGEKFSRLKIIGVATPKMASGHPVPTVRCRCDCGLEIDVKLVSVRRKNTKSCGCLKADKFKARTTTHGFSMENGRTYRIWRGMLARCDCKGATGFRYYGERGITVCSRWRDFLNFLSDMGECPDGLSIDRKDFNGNYSCGQCEECITNGWTANCRWATNRVQAMNRCDIRLVPVAGELVSLKEAERALGFKINTIRGRMNRGMSFEDAISKPIRR